MRGIFLGPPLVGGLIVFLSATTGADFWGRALAVFILTWPPMALLVVAFSKISEAVRKRGQPKKAAAPTARAQARGTLLFLAGIGFASIVALMVCATLVAEGENSDNSTLVVAGYAVIFGFAAVILIPGVGLPLLIGMPSIVRLFRSLAGREKDLYKGMRCALTQRLGDADTCLFRYRTRYPKDHRAPLWQAIVLLQQYRQEEALGLADEALSLQLSPEGFLTRGQALLNLGATEEALSDFRSGLALNPRMPFCRSFSGYALIDLRRLDEAIAEFEKEKLKSSLLFMGMGAVRRFLGDRQLAAEEYKRAIRQAAADQLFGLPGSAALIACARAELGEISEAKEAAARILEKSPSDLPSRYAVARIAMAEGDPDRIETMLREIIPVSPHQGVMALTDPEFTPLLTEERFRRLLAWALGARGQNLQRVNSRVLPPASAS